MIGKVIRVAAYVTATGLILGIVLIAKPMIFILDTLSEP